MSPHRFFLVSHLAVAALAIGCKSERTNRQAEVIADHRPASEPTPERDWIHSLNFQNTSKYWLDVRYLFIAKGMNGRAYERWATVHLPPKVGPRNGQVSTEAHHYLFAREDKMTQVNPAQYLVDPRVKLESQEWCSPWHEWRFVLGWSGDPPADVRGQTFSSPVSGAPRRANPPPSDERSLVQRAVALAKTDAQNEVRWGNGPAGGRQFTLDCFARTGSVPAVQEAGWEDPTIEVAREDGAVRHATASVAGSVTLKCIGEGRSTPDLLASARASEGEAADDYYDPVLETSHRDTTRDDEGCDICECEP